MDIRPWGYVTAYDPPVCERDYSLCVWEDGQPKTLCESRECQSTSSNTTACKLACEDPYLKKCYASEDECPRPTTPAPVTSNTIPIPTSNKNVIQSSSSTSNVPASNNSNNNIIDLCIFFSMLVLIFAGLVYVMMSS
jgi:hypothetical protein